MGRFIYKLQRLSKWSITIVAGIVFCASIIVYILATQNLVKPATSSEALEFLFTYTNEYMWALLCGLIAKIVPFIFLLVAIGGLLNYFSYNDIYNNFIKMSVINAVAFIVATIIQVSLVRFWESIAIVAIAIILLVYALSNAE